MLLSAVSVLVVAQSSSEIPEGIMNNPVLTESLIRKPGYYSRYSDHATTGATKVTVSISGKTGVICFLQQPRLALQLTQPPFRYLPGLLCRK